jgi:uncharacterized protein YegP (UPF0339 family)
MAKTTVLEIYKDKKGMYRFRLLAKNGEPVVASEAYTKKASAMKAASSLVDWVSTALLVDRDMKAEVVKKTTASVSKKAEKKVPTSVKKK